MVGKLCGAFLTDSTTASTTGLSRWDFPGREHGMNCCGLDHLDSSLLSPEEYAIELLSQVGLYHWIEKLPEIFPTTVPCGEYVTFVYPICFLHDLLKRKM